MRKDFLGKILAMAVLATMIALGAGCVYQSADSRMLEKVKQEKAESKYRAEQGIKAIKEIPRLPKNWETIVENEISQHLKDPYSAKYSFDGLPSFYSFSNCGRFAKSAVLSVGTSPLAGYAGLVFVNAKNSYGAYAGKTPWFYMITDGSISFLATNKYGIWHTIDDVKQHLENSYTECLIMKIGVSEDLF